MAAPGRSPGAITGYDNMPGYGKAWVMYRELAVTARRLEKGRYGLDRAIAEKSLRVLLATAEAGARLQPARRTRLYRAAWMATHDCDALLRAAATLELTRPELLAAAHAVVRQTQQAVTIATGVMTRRQRRSQADG
jgi:hypothetical protein